ncbi:MAG: hypothetical protein OXF75_11560 [Acidimicrobiaceae bacterium]|nr:hypothetical protein [Acidimicrobiaceae bacterium]
MARLDHNALTESISNAVGATPDPSGEADLVFDKGSIKGSIIVASETAALKGAFKRAKKINGYRWVAINRDDLFGANPLSLGSKAGILDANGKVLKNADTPRRKV